MVLPAHTVVCHLPPWPQLLTYGGVVFVLGVNIAMRALLKRVTAFERHKSRTGGCCCRCCRCAVVVPLGD